MRGVGDFGAGQQHLPDDGGADPRSGRRGDGSPRPAVDSGARRDARPGERDARDGDGAHDPGAQRFRRRLSAALGEGAADATPSGAAALASLFHLLTAPGAGNRDGAAPAEPRGAAAPRPPSAGEAPTGVPVCRDADRDAAEAWRSLLADAPDAAGDRAGGRPRGAASAANREMRLLAASDAAGLAEPAWAPFAPPAPAAEVAASPESRVERAVAEIERAIQAETAAGAVGPITVTVPLALHDSALVGVAVTLTPDGIDVVLSRAAGVAASDAGLAEAARDLVSRLQRRAPRGVVRILDAIDDASARTEGGSAPADGADRFTRS